MQALNLIKLVLENSGPVFRQSDNFAKAIKQYLCLSLLRNSMSQFESIFRCVMPSTPSRCYCSK